MKFNVNNFIVPRAGAAIPAAATRLWDLTTDVVNLPVGSFSLFAPVVNSGDPVTTATSPTVTTAPEFKLIMRRDTAADASPLPLRTYDQSPSIRKDMKVSVKGTPARAESNGAWLVGGITGSVGVVPIQSLQSYLINASIHGWRTDLYNGNNTPLKTGRFTTPNFVTSAIYTTAAQQRDVIMQNLASEFNNQGQQNLVAICIDSTATASTSGTNVTTVLAASTATVGTVVIIGFSNSGQPIRLTLDAKLINTFARLISTGAVLGTAQIVPYALPTAANLAVAARIVAGGRVAATATSTVDRLLIIALSAQTAFYDEVVQRQDRVVVGLDGAFGVTTTNQVGVPAVTSAGLGKDLKVQYEGMFRSGIYPGGKNYTAQSVAFGNEILDGGLYDVYVINTEEARTSSSGFNTTSPQQTIVAILNTNRVGFAGYTGAANPQKAYFETAINSWMNSSNNPHVNLAL